MTPDNRGVRSAGVLKCAENAPVRFAEGVSNCAGRSVTSITVSSNIRPIAQDLLPDSAFELAVSADLQR